mgnify:CR=1 FL=1
MQEIWAFWRNIWNYGWDRFRIQRNIQPVLSIFKQINDGPMYGAQSYYWNFKGSTKCCLVLKRSITTSSLMWWELDKPSQTWEFCWGQHKFNKRDLGKNAGLWGNPDLIVFFFFSPAQQCSSPGDQKLRVKEKPWMELQRRLSRNFRSKKKGRGKKEQEESSCEGGPNFAERRKEGKKGRWKPF